MLDNWNDSFAKSQLEKYGWKKGDGLGKNKHGNTKHITVKVKNDTKGIGGNQQQWDFAWWDHLYNKSASSVTVEKDESKEIKVAVKKKSAERRSKTGIISTHRPTGTSATTTTTTSSMASIAEEQNLMDSVKSVHSCMAQTIARTSLYSGFVKSSNVLVGTNTQKNDDKENDDDDEDDEQKDYSIKMTDEELFAACEGRTARKGGRGLVEQKGKYARVMQDYIHKREASDDEQVTDKKRKREDKDEEASSTKKKKAKKEKKDKKDKKEKKEKKAKKEKKKAKKEKK
ncbi:hypothetical protein O0I10_008649 [Lichtheimia ornata]|uniref:G-patch domain-containing protein n=1 Tax=Lichtheimia ornata TaxID=688661 RepID=A0AAD7XWR1_9FUNG|nr:uncharacterized protein O0I10_008649 [Lichtheimia ornata]KAJ8655763.1 hypothetical protein O0I10_008649 [Lichtheimia ornata]